MKPKAYSQIKSLIASKCFTLTKLAQIMSEKTGKKYTLDSLSHKLRRGAISYDEVLVICEILDYEIQFINKNNN